jgi:hypothetical protein
MASKGASPQLVEGIKCTFRPPTITNVPEVFEMVLQHLSELSDSDFSGRAMLREAIEALRSAYDDVRKMKTDSEVLTAYLNVDAAVSKLQQIELNIRNRIGKDYSMRVTSILFQICMNLAGVCVHVMDSVNDKFNMMKLNE